MKTKINKTFNFITKMINKPIPFQVEIVIKINIINVFHIEGNGEHPAIE
jgi:hypothetical protein